MTGISPLRRPSTTLETFAALLPGEASANSASVSASRHFLAKIARKEPRNHSAEKAGLASTEEDVLMRKVDSAASVLEVKLQWAMSWLLLL